MSTTADPVGTALQQGVNDALTSMKAAGAARANVDSVAVFTGLLKKAEESAQAAL